VWARPKRKGKVCCFLNLIFNAKTIPENIEIVLKARKILKIPKISGKFPEAHWDMNNPNKVFGSHEKNILEPSNK
jgi:hypothetical protein